MIANATKLKIIKYYGTGSAMSRLLCVWIITTSVYFVRMTLYGLNILASSLFVTIHSVKELPTSYSLYCGWGLVPVFMLHIFFGQMIRIGNKLKFVDPMFGIRFRAPWGLGTWNLLVSLISRERDAHRSRSSARSTPHWPITDQWPSQ